MIDLPIWKGYLVTLIEIICFLVVGFILTDFALSKLYESVGISFVGNVGSVWVGLSFILFSLYTLFKTYVLSHKSPLLIGRINSLIFWMILILSVYSVVSPFVRGAI